MKFLNNIQPSKSVLVDFTTSAGESRKLYWDEDYRTLSTEMDNGVILQNGQELYQPLVINDSGVLIPNGSVVMYDGSVGASGKMKVKLAIGNGSISADQIMGVATQDIPNGQSGYVTIYGSIRGINTTGSSVSETWAMGDTLYLHPTIPGGLTKVKPSAPNLKVLIAHVINVHATIGSLDIGAAGGSELGGTDSNVQITNPVDKDLLVYSGATGIWVNKAITPSDIGAQAISEKGVANGYASLDENGKVPAEQLSVSGGIIIPLYNRVVLESNTNEVTIGIPNFDRYKDVMFVYQNSTYISGSNQDYYISTDNLKIIKTTGTWASGTIIDFVVSQQASSDIEVISIVFDSSYFTATENTTTHCPLNYASYNPLMDKLSVYYQNLLLFEDIDYTVNGDGISIDLIGFSINANETLRYEIWKRVKYYDGTVDGTLIVDNTISVDKLNSSVVEMLNRSTEITTTSTTQTQLFKFNKNNYGSAKLLIQATRGTIRHLSEILVLHDGTTSFASEYGIIKTGVSLYGIDVTIIADEVVILTTSTSATSTNYKVKYELINA